MEDTPEPSFTLSMSVVVRFAFLFPFSPLEFYSIKRFENETLLLPIGMEITIKTDKKLK